MLHKIPKINYSLYSDEKNRKAYYGLPQEIRFCKKCVISNQRPNSAKEYEHKNDTNKETINFNDDGICDACLQSDLKFSIDWDLREKELVDLCNKHRSKDGAYDCLIPGSGGKDSFYQAHILKYKYGMNPLTVTWAPNLYTDWGRRNHLRWIHAGFDNHLVTPNGIVTRLLTRLSVENLFHPFQSFMIGQKAMAPKFASKFGISLIFYGENEAEYGNPLADNDESVRDWSYFTSEDHDNIFIAGSSIKSLKEDYGLTKNDLNIYMPANPLELRENKTEVHYLGYYLKWHPQGAYYYAVDHGDFEASPERTAGTYSKYNSIDDKIDDLHFYTYYTKFGIGRTTYDAAQEVRSGDLEREEAVMLVNRYDGEFPERFTQELFDYLSVEEKNLPIAFQQFEQPKMDLTYFMLLTEKFRSPHLWNYDGENWTIRKKVHDL